MAEKKNIISKKLVVKKSGKGGTIADKIVQQKKEEEESRVAKEVAKKTAIEQAQKEQELEKHKKSKPQAVKIQTPEEAKQQKDKETEKTKKPLPKTIFIEPTVAKKKEGAGAAPAAPAKAKPGKKAKTNNLREDILRKEEHQKFFLKQKSLNPKQASEVASNYASVPKEIKITEFIQVSELARKLNLRSSDVISKLMRMGVMATITQSIDADTAILIAEEFGCKVNVVSLYDETVIQEEEDEAADLVERPPVVTIMGHVDHGKTKLLDALRQTDIVASEAGGITQHIGAYQITTPKGKITFLDTPGHEAFTAMRARGANITDIVVLVVAADDGVMPQTVEAIKHAQEAKVPIIVAINKIDKESANVEKIRQDLTQYELVSEEWGGTTPFIGISALKKLNLDKLLDLILTTAEVLELKANPQKNAIGTVIEARLDQGRGPVATILIQNGTLHQSDPYVVGLEGGRVRALINDRGDRVSSAPPSMPVEILGLTGVPHAGDPFHGMSSERDARIVVEKRQELNRQEQAQRIKKVKLENLNQVIQDGKVSEFKMIIKADVRGSAEAIESSLKKLSTSEIRINVIFSGTGEISESDVMLASASGAAIIGFNVRANSKVKEIASREGIDIRYYTIIYQIIDDIKDALSGLLSPNISEKITGTLEIRQIFKISNSGNIGGCMVTSGFVKRANPVRLIRKGEVLFTGALKTLKRFKDDVAEVKEGFECGVNLEGFQDIQEGDIIESFMRVETSRKLDDVIKEEDRQNKK